MSGGGADGCRQGKGGQRRGGRLLVLDDLMLVIEAYALLGGESHCPLLDPHCRSGITALYCRALGKVETRLVQYVVRPLQALLLSCPILAGN